MKGFPAALYLENGHLFRGMGFGAEKASGGEAVFNTGMTGYQEVFTDPSYRQQILVMTYPHIGNTGINFEDLESRGLDLMGVVVRDYNPEPSSWRSRQTLSDYLKEAGVPLLSDVDTRALTRILRDEGAQRGIIFPEGQGDALSQGKKYLESVPAMEGLELVSQVSTKKAYEFQPELPSGAGTVVVYDYGAKHNILRHLKSMQFKVWVVPYNLPHQEVLKEKPKAVILSNGPGDPATVPNATEEISALIGKVPILAICMGHQLLARSLGSKTYKLKFGHHGVNHPVKDLTTGRIMITSQNHGFSVRAEDLKNKDIVLSHISLNDQTVEGFQSEKMRLYSVQFHPEAKPGPSDAAYIFENFIRGFVQ